MTEFVKVYFATLIPLYRITSTCLLEVWLLYSIFVCLLSSYFIRCYCHQPDIQVNTTSPCQQAQITGIVRHYNVAVV